jgi:hypothetical protein
LETYPAYANPRKGKRLVIPSHSIEPGYRILLFPFREGDVLPKTTFQGEDRLSIAWPEQEDSIQFAAGASGRSSITIRRGGETVFSFGKGGAQ